MAWIGSRVVNLTVFVCVLQGWWFPARGRRRSRCGPWRWSPSWWPPSLRPARPRSGARCPKRSTRKGTARNTPLRQCRQSRLWWAASWTCATLTTQRILMLYATAQQMKCIMQRPLSARSSVLVNPKTRLFGSPLVLRYVFDHRFRLRKHSKFESARVSEFQWKFNEFQSNI